jgi:hypothetical protein
MPFDVKDPPRITEHRLPTYSEQLEAMATPMVRAVKQKMEEPSSLESLALRLCALMVAGTIDYKEVVDAALARDLLAHEAVHAFYWQATDLGQHDRLPFAVTSYCKNNREPPPRRRGERHVTFGPDRYPVESLSRDIGFTTAVLLVSKQFSLDLMRNDASKGKNPSGTSVVRKILKRDGRAIPTESRCNAIVTKWRPILEGIAHAQLVRLVQGVNSVTAT